MGLTLELTPVQRDTLTALVNLHRQEGQAIKGEEIAELVGRHPGTIRNQMHSLRALNLVEGFIGPKGGYKATAAAYDALSLDNNGDGDEVIVPVVRDGVVVEGVSATEIVFNKIMHSAQPCSGLIRIIGNIRNFDIGDDVEVGPTPLNKLYIAPMVWVMISSRSFSEASSSSAFLCSVMSRIDSIAPTSLPSVS